MKNRKSVRILALLFLFAMILVQACSGGVAFSGSFYAHDYELAQGEEISGKDAYIVVFNKVDERVCVDVEYEAPEFIEVGLSTKSCFLDPDEYERIYISLKAKEDAVPGDYKVKVIVTIKEVEGDLPTKVLTSATQEADVTVVGKYAQSEIPWYDQEGMQIAKSQNKPTMIFFYSDRCPASAKLAEVFADTRVINMSKNFVPIVGSSGLDRQYGIRYVPTIVFTNSYGREVHRVVGYQDADMLVNEMQYALMVSTTLDVTFFSQRDPAWRDKKLDHSAYSLGEYGCALTSAAMVAKYFGYDTAPDKLNTSLTAVGGLDTSGIISWEKVAEVSEGKVAWIESVEATWSQIDQELSSDNPVICSVNCPLGTHFIVFVGKSGDEHYFLDPYDKQSAIREWPNGAHGVYTLNNLKIYHGIPTTLVGDGSFWVAVSNPAGAYICNDSLDFTFSRNLKRGDSGDDVKYLQIVLNANPAT